MSTAAEVHNCRNMLHLVVYCVRKWQNLAIILLTYLTLCNEQSGKPMHQLNCCFCWYVGLLRLFLAQESFNCLEVDESCHVVNQNDNRSLIDIS